MEKAYMFFRFGSENNRKRQEIFPKNRKV